MKQCTVCVVIFFILSLANAFNFTPMVKNIPPKGKERVQSFFLENKGKEKVAVQLNVYKRTTNELGEEIRHPSELVTVFPEQVVLMPEQKRTVRVSWNGPEQVATEEAYRLVVEQMPVGLKEKTKDKTGVIFLMKYVASIYITPENAKSKVVMVEAEQVKKGSTKQLKLNLKNIGNAHQVLNTMWLDFKSKGQKVRIEAKNIKTLVSINLLPGNQQIFYMPWPDGLSFIPTETEIGFAQ